ncbi:MAG TPA: peptidoglycan DD-metalloendopeptidase family protein [bacterium]
MAAGVRPFGVRRCFLPINFRVILTGTGGGMQRTARRFGVLTFVFLTISLAAAYSHEVETPEISAPPGPFLSTAAADQQIASALSTVVGTGTPAGLSTSAARMSSESVRAQFWLPTAPEEPRTVVIKDGQSLWDIAAAWGVSVETIAAANNLPNVDLVRPGQKLLIPTADDPQARAKLAALAAKAVTKVQPKTQAAVAGTPTRAPRAQTKPASGSLVVTLGEGQTLWSLARAHGTSVDALVEANGLADANRIRAGRRLVIPGHPAASAPSRATTARVGAQRVGEAFTKASSTAVRIARGFLWPARGQLTSRFGWRRWRHHDGIDIAAPYGSPIYAARPGRVIYAGWYFAYGRAVIVDHGDGLQTLYGHASELLVRTGETVNQGELIARVGSSGRATGPHVHFEVRVNGKAVNPMRYMN